MMKMKIQLLVTVGAIIYATFTNAFSAPIFAPSPTLQRTTPTKTKGVEIELPNFDELFSRVQQVSPLAKTAFEQRPGGFAAITESGSGLKWKSLESRPSNQVFRVDKIDDFQGLGCPILRFRAKMEGPVVMTPFTEFIMDINERKKWDPSIAVVDEIYPVEDLDVVNMIMGPGRFGDCRKLGVGYCRTKKYLAVPGREQLTLCGVQEFANGATLLWGTEMEEWHNHLLPEDYKRTVRARSHLFSIAMVPSSDNCFDVEYCLQIDTNFPNWVTTPMLTEVIKGMFRYAQDFYKSPKIDPFVSEQQEKNGDALLQCQSLLMTP